MNGENVILGRVCILVPMVYSQYIIGKANIGVNVHSAPLLP